MALFVKNLLIVDEFDNTIYKAKYVRAEVGINNALNILKDKQGNREAKGIIKCFAKRLKSVDKEFKEYFKL